MNAAQVTQPDATPSLRRPTLGFTLGKYREILIAVAFFLLFDLAVLVLNFYVSFQISEDAVSINLAGRQRMLTQRLSKGLFASELAVANGPLPAPLADELRLATRLFDETLTGFRQGGAVTGGDGKAVQLVAASSPKSADILARSVALWEPWRQLLSHTTLTPADVRAAAAYARAHNLTLLGLMNELTTDLESAANQRASQLRMVQTGGIVLALLNFLFILFKFIRRLRQSDDATEQATEETREILSVVREGLFLLTPQYTLGTQLSQSVSTILGRAVRPGDHFLALLAPLVSARTLDDARGYTDLLFLPHIKEDLVQSINPLTEVAITTTDALGHKHQRHLSMRFNRVTADGEIRHLLVTVQDVSSRIELEQKLQGEQQRAQREFDLLVRAFETDPGALRGFVDRSEASLLEVNDLLRQVEAGSDAKQLRRIVDAVYRHVHAVKGEASMLSLDLLTATAHQFESQIQVLREAGTFAGDALLALPLPLEELLTRLQALKRSVLRDRAATPPAADFSVPMTALVARIAQEMGKPTQLTTSLAALTALPTASHEALQKVAVQLVRNAVVHGVEDGRTRAALGKPALATVDVTLHRNDTNQVELVVRDDGAGLDVTRVRARLQALGWFKGSQLDEMSPAQVLAQIFRPGFSTATSAGEHAGRGVGLDIVSAEVRRLGARLLVSTKPDHGTTFRVRLSA
jgi:HPt (histidine-containing phosphotransfer) domain-containing protein